MPRNKPPQTTASPSSATKPTARAANGRFRAPNAEATHSLLTDRKAATHGPDLFGLASGCAHHASDAAAEPRCSEIDAEFEQFYTRYPRKRSRGYALRAFRTARKKATFAEIMAGLERYKFSPDPAYQPHPATWLNGERWNDEELDLAADPWGLNAYLVAQPSIVWGWNREALEEILIAAGLDRTWRGDLDTMAKWLTDGYRPDSIALVLAEETARQSIVLHRLAHLDRAVRQRAFRWNETRLEWTRQRP